MRPFIGWPPISSSFCASQSWAVAGLSELSTAVWCTANQRNSVSVCVCAKDTVKYEAHGDFNGGTVVKTPYSHCRGTRSIPGRGTRSRRLQGQKVKQQTTTKIYVRNKLGRNICEIYNKKYAAHEIHYRSALTDEHLQLTEYTWHPLWAPVKWNIIPPADSHLLITRAGFQNFGLSYSISTAFFTHKKLHLHCILDFASWPIELNIEGCWPLT